MEVICRSWHGALKGVYALFVHAGQDHVSTEKKKRNGMRRKRRSLRDGKKKKRESEELHLSLPNPFLLTHAFCCFLLALLTN